MDEKQKLSKDILSFFVENLKHRKQERLEKKKFKVKKYFSLGEEITHSILHGIGVLLAISSLILLQVKAEGVTANVGVSVFGSSAILLYLMSTLYHAFPKGKTKRVFERLDHSSIFLLIAGTFTPFCLILFKGPSGWIIFGIQWGLAIVGITLKSIWIDRLELIHLLIYLLMGWSIIIKIGALINNLGVVGFLLLLIGGLCYSIGTLFYVFSWFKYHHAIWHLFALAGTILHFFTIYFYLL